MTLRLIIDYARKTRQKLFILFIDFEKAYDKVRRDKLFQLLREAGCGKLMLLSLKAIYKNTKILFKTVIILANLGVKQGSSASCILFILYVDRMIKMVKNAFQDDGFLGSLHIAYVDGRYCAPRNQQNKIDRKIPKMSRLLRGIWYVHQSKENTIHGDKQQQT